MNECLEEIEMPADSAAGGEYTTGGNRATSSSGIAISLGAFLAGDRERVKVPVEDAEVF